MGTGPKPRAAPSRSNRVRFGAGISGTKFLADPDIANAPPALERKETAYAGPDRTAQTSVETAGGISPGPDISW